MKRSLHATTSRVVPVAFVCLSGCADASAGGPGGAVVSSEEMASSVTIVRDTYGVPHIYGPTDAAVVFGAAYAQAEDNWWQVEDNFVRAIGRTTELYGENGFTDDYLTRAMEIPRLSVDEFERASPEMQAMYEAYAAGFNYYLETHPDTDVRLLDHIEPWYTLALIRFKYHHNEYLGYAGLRPEHTERLLESRGLASHGSAAESALAFHRELSPDGERALGSNEVALAGMHTASGYPMLLINPHVAFFGLSQYWEVHLISDEGLEFSGQSPHYFDQAPLYAAKRFKPAWFSQSDVEANAERTYAPGERGY